jgi:sugar lactone lactonase YvrE
MYWVDRGNPTTVRKRTPAGKIVDIAQANFRNVRWLTVSRTGTMYLVDLHDLVRIEPGGEVRTVAKNLADRRRSFLLTTDIHAIMGLWTDPQGNLYAAVFSDKAVKKVSPDGRVGIVFRSDPFWGPTGGVIDRDGSLWILEYSETHSVRVQKIDKEGKITIF